MDRRCTIRQCTRVLNVESCLLYDCETVVSSPTPSIPSQCRCPLASMSKPFTVKVILVKINVYSGADVHTTDWDKTKRLDS